MTCDHDGGKVLARRDGEIRKRLVILQRDIERRMNVFHQTRFNKQRLPFALARHDVEVHHAIEHGLLPRTKIRRWNEVARDAITQPQCLSHIKHTAERVLHQVDARCFGERTSLFTE